MGWYIFFGILILLSLPLFIPIIVKTKWDDEVMEWSVHIGFLQIAPDTKARLERWKNRSQKIFRPVLKFFKLLFSLLVLIIKAIIWPFQKFIQLFRWLRHSISKSKKVDETSEVLSPEYTEEDTEQSIEVIQGDEEETVKTEGIEEAEALDVREETKDLVLEYLADDDFEQDEVELSEEEVDDDEPPSEQEAESTSDKESFEEKKKRKSEKQFKNPFSTINEKLKNFESLKDKFDLYLGYYRKYSPLGKKILRSFFKLISRYFHAFIFQRLRVVCKVGGDPAILGAISGWHYALGYTIHPQLPQRIVFLPDYEEQSLTVSGSLNISVWIWPIRFVLPTLAFIFGLPWIRLYKTYREYRKRDEQS